MLYRRPRFLTLTLFCCSLAVASTGRAETVARHVRAPQSRAFSVPLVTLPTARKVLHSQDGSKVFDFGGYDTVLFPNAGVAGPSVCVSVQKGCSLGKKARSTKAPDNACKFCSTGRYVPFGGNLGVDEVTHQAKTAFAQSADLARSKRLRVVFAGMGDSSFNPKGVVGAMRELQRAYPRQTTDFVVASVGTPPTSVQKLGKEIVAAYRDGGLKRESQVYLQLSMHAATDAKRRYVMPIAEKANLDEVLRGMLGVRDEISRHMKLLEDPQYPNRAMVTLNYLMLGKKAGPAGTAFEGNATEADLQALIALVKKHGKDNFVVRLSAYNPDKRDGARSFGTVPEATFAHWAKELESAGIFVRRFHSQGADVKGGCGQLGQRGVDAD